MSAHNRTIAVIGLGYVGLPVAVAFGRTSRTIGFDINAARVAEHKWGHDSTLEVEDADLAASDIAFTCDAKDLRAADFHIVAVPTPVDDAHQLGISSRHFASRMWPMTCATPSGSSRGSKRLRGGGPTGLVMTCGSAGR